MTPAQGRTTPARALPLKQWPATERPRERLLSAGPRHLTDAELLALVLGASARGAGGVLETCRRVLLHSGGLAGLRRMRPGSLMRVPGVGQARACALLAVGELARRIGAASRLRGPALGNSQDAYAHVRSRLELLEQELFLVLALDVKHRVLAVHEVAQGSMTAVEVHPRDVFSPLVREGAAATIVAHNHPSGDPEPSPDDVHLTLRLKQAGEMMGIPLLDHLVIGCASFVSLADRGVLQ